MPALYLPGCLPGCAVRGRAEVSGRVGGAQRRFVDFAGRSDREGKLKRPAIVGS